MLPKPRALITVFTFLCFVLAIILKFAEQSPEPINYSQVVDENTTEAPPLCMQNADWGQECKAGCYIGKNICSENGLSLICEPLPKAYPMSTLMLNNTGYRDTADQFFCNADPECDNKLCPFEKPVCSKGACFDPMEDPDNCGSLGNKCPKEKSFCARGVCSTDPVQRGIPFTAKYSTGGSKWVEVPPSCIDLANPPKLLCDPTKVQPRTTWPY